MKNISSEADRRNSEALDSTRVHFCDVRQLKQEYDQNCTNGLTNST